MNNSPARKLHIQVAALLKRSFPAASDVSYQDAMIKLVISREDFEHRFGELLHRIQQLIDEQHPFRATDMAILVRDSGSRFEHVFKIWKTSAQ